MLKYLLILATIISFVAGISALPGQVYNLANQDINLSYGYQGQHILAQINAPAQWIGVGFNTQNQIDGATIFIGSSTVAPVEYVIQGGNLVLASTQTLMSTYNQEVNSELIVAAYKPISSLATNVNLTIVYFVSDSITLDYSNSTVGILGQIEITDFDFDNFAADADCNDSNSLVNPLATEVCNMADDNCNGSIDEGLVGCTIFADEVLPLRTNKRSTLVDNPTGIVYYNYYLYVLDDSQYVIHQIDPLTGSATTLAGLSGVQGSADGIGAAARFNNLIDSALAASVGELYIVDGGSAKIRKVVIATGEVTTLPFTFTTPTSIAVNPTGRRIYVGDDATNSVYLLLDGVQSVYASSLSGVQSLALDGSGNLFIGESSGTIRVTDGNTIQLFAGQPGNPGSAVGPALGGGQIGDPFGLLVTSMGLLVADAANNQIRLIAGGEISIFAGSTAGLGLGNAATSSQFNTPYSITQQGPFIYFTDQTSATIIKVGTCHSQGVTINNECQCFDGFSGTECEITPLVSCNIIRPSSDELTSSNIPVVNAAQTFYKSDTLNFEIDSPVVSYRVASYRFDNGVACPNLFNKVHDYSGACQERNIVQVPWVNRVSCGFVRDNSNTDYLIWRGQAIADLVDIAGHLRNQIVMRTTIAKYKLAVRFPRTVNVTVYPLNVLSDVNLLAAITYQAVDTTVTPANATFSFTTSLQWPYQVGVYSLNSAPNGWNQYTIVETTSVGMCPMTPGSICMQTFDVSIRTDAAACNIDGNYVYGATIVCRIADCPTFAPASITAIVDSEDYCVEVDATADLAGTLAIYRDVARLISATNFAQFDTAYFRAQLTSTSTVESVDLVRVSYWKPGATSSTLIYDRSTGISVGFTFAEETSPTVGQSYSDFNFVLDQTNFPQWPEDIVSFRVDATIEATFKDTSKRSFDYSFEQPTITEQASVVVSREGQVGLRGKIVMIRDNSHVAESSAASVAVSMIVLIIAAFAFLF